MSKMTEALRKAEQDRDEFRHQDQDLFKDDSTFQKQQDIPPQEVIVNKNRYGKAGNSWLVWIFFIGVIATVLIVFNYEGSKDTVPLSEIFPDENAVEVEYEFVDGAKQKAQEVKAEVKKDLKEIRETILEQTSQTTAAMEQKVEKKVTEVKNAVVQKASQETAKLEPSAQKAVPVQTQINGAFTIQVASFKTEDKAQVKAKELQAKNYSAYIVSKNLGEKGIWYRVYVGEFTTKSEAENFHTSFKNDYSNSFIIAIKN